VLLAQEDTISNAGVQGAIIICLLNKNWLPLHEVLSEESAAVWQRQRGKLSDGATAKHSADSCSMVVHSALDERKKNEKKREKTRKNEKKREKKRSDM
jgi:hypothetical protein